MEYRRQLIDLYGQYEASAVISKPEYAQLYAQYGQETQFLWLRAQLDEMKDTVEQWIETIASPQEQLREAIRLLRTYRKRETERDLFYDLVVAMYGAKWGAARMAYLEKALAAVRLPRDYFLSFTTRHSTPPDVNPINTRYKYFIKKKLEKTFNDKDQRERNLFAEAINQIFSERASGYFFPKSEDDTSIVMDELQKELNQCMGFVQIIQTELFQYTKGINYCFLEWGRAKDRFGNNEDHIVYISGEADRVWENSPPDRPYLLWHSHAASKKAPATPLHRVFNAADIEKTTQFIETIRDRDILGAWDRLELAAP
jgi:hypothetical protein